MSTCRSMPYRIFTQRWLASLSNQAVAVNHIDKLMVLDLMQLLDPSCQF